MLVTGSKSCIFCIQTCHSSGLFFEYIPRDAGLIFSLCSAASQFFEGIVLPEMFSQKVFKTRIVKSIVSDILSHVIKIVSEPQLQKTSSFSNEKISHVDFNTAAMIEVTSEYTCSLCSFKCVSNPKGSHELSIECSKCCNWFHMNCAGICGT